MTKLLNKIFANKSVRSIAYLLSNEILILLGLVLVGGMLVEGVIPGILSRYLFFLIIPACMVGLIATIFSLEKYAALETKKGEGSSASNKYKYFFLSSIFAVTTLSLLLSLRKFDIVSIILTLLATALITRLLFPGKIISR